MTTHPVTSPTIFSLSALRDEHSRAISPVPTHRGTNRFAAFIGVLAGNIVVWSTLMLGIGILLAVQVALVGVVLAAVLR